MIDPNAHISRRNIAANVDLVTASKTYGNADNPTQPREIDVTNAGSSTIAIVLADPSLCVGDIVFLKFNKDSSGGLTVDGLGLTQDTSSSDATKHIYFASQSAWTKIN